MKKVLVHFHLFYHDQIDYFIKKLSNINCCRWDLFVTYIETNEESFKKIRQLKPDAKLIQVENRGYDVWPFISVIQSVNLDDYDYILKIHTKRGLLNQKNEIDYWWRNNLIECLLGNKFTFLINLLHLHFFETEGMICTILHMSDCYTDKSPEANELLEPELKLLNFKGEQRKFCAGTMFFARANIYKFLQSEKLTENRFACQNISDNCGTLAHVYERIFCIAVQEFNYKIHFKDTIQIRLKNFLQAIFSLKNSPDKSHKIFQFLGLKLKIKYTKNNFKNDTLLFEIESKNIKDIPIYIISYNRFEMLKNLVEYLERHNYNNIHIIDNCSTYPPLLEYLKTSRYKVYHMMKNYGHKVFWECGEFDNIIQNEYYVITDPDIYPIEECKDDFLEEFYNILKINPEYTKVGFSLKLDDIPPKYKFYEIVQNWEKQFYKEKFKYKDYYIYNADIDTTFALYRPNKNISSCFYKAIRTGFPYQVRHLPWYLDEKNLSEEIIYYNQQAKNNVTTWNTKFDNTTLDKRVNNYSKTHYSLTEYIFSLRNKEINSRKHKILTIFGMQFDITPKVKINLGDING